MLTLSDRTNELLYKGKVVGTIEVEKDKSVLKLDLEFAHHTPDDWITVLAHLSTGLRAIEPPAREPDFIFETTFDEVEEVFAGPITLDEKNISAGGQTWQFHKTDVDPWPSLLHGHSGRQKLDAVTGKIYDINTRKECGKLDKKPLARLQGQLRGHKDFPHAADLLPEPTRAGKIIEALERQQKE